jgi:hypothetical protein
LENTQAIKLIDKILKNLDETGINSDALIDDIKELRGYAIEQKAPLLVKVLRYTCEHIEEHQSFLIPILSDEPLDEENDSEQTEDVSPVDSLKYLIALPRNLNNKGNLSDLKEYKELLMAY